MATLPPNFTLLQVVPDLDTGGAEQSALDVAEAVVRAGGRAIVVSRGGRMVERLRDVGGEFIPLPVHSKNPARILANAGALAAIIRQQKVSLIHVRSRAPAFSAWVASRRTGVPMVATYHGAHPSNTPLKRWYNAIMTRGDLVIANSEYTRERIVAQFKTPEKKLVTIPRGIDLERFDPAAVSPARVEALREKWGVDFDDPRLKVLMPGRLTRLKGHLILIEALERLRQQGHDDLLLLIVGGDQGRSAYKGEIESAIGAAGLNDAVKLVGVCADMPAAYMLGDVVVAAKYLVPEAFGRTAAEGQAMLRPVLASAIGGQIEIVDPGVTGWLVEPGDPEAWAKALFDAYAAGPNQRAIMGAAGRARVAERYSLQGMTEATLGAYASLMARR